MLPLWVPGVAGGSLACIAHKPSWNYFLERGHARDLPTRRCAAESCGLDLGRQTGACAPRPPVPPSPQSSGNYVIMFAAVCCQTDSLGGWTLDTDSQHVFIFYNLVFTYLMANFSNTDSYVALHAILFLSNEIFP